MYRPEYNKMSFKLLYKAVPSLHVFTMLTEHPEIKLCACVG